MGIIVQRRWYIACAQYFHRHTNATIMWTEENLAEGGNALKKSFTFKDFSDAFAFMTRVALLAEKHDHHPCWSNVYNKVDITLNTHSEGNTITEKDRTMATEIDKLVC